MQRRAIQPEETASRRDITSDRSAEEASHAPAALVFRNVSFSCRRLRKPFEKEAERVDAIADVSLDVLDNELVVVVGRSGCGKSTLLSIAAGLVQGWTGTVELHNRPIQGPGRERGIIFQEFALFPWLTVQENVEFPLKVIGVERVERTARARSLLASMELRGFEARFPRELSGGMKQRVAVARAYAADPDVLLMDEPFGALDAQTRGDMQRALIKMWEAHRKTVLFVTHDVGEALLLADRVIVLGGRPGRKVGEVSLAGDGRPRDLADSAIQVKHREIMELISSTPIAARADAFSAKVDD